MGMWEEMFVFKKISYNFYWFLMALKVEMEKLWEEENFNKKAILGMVWKLREEVYYDKF